MNSPELKTVAAGTSLVLLFPASGSSSLLLDNSDWNDITCKTHLPEAGLFARTIERKHFPYLYCRLLQQLSQQLDKRFTKLDALPFKLTAKIAQGR